MSRWALRITLGAAFAVLALLALTFWIIVAGIMHQGE